MKVNWSCTDKFQIATDKYTRDAQRVKTSERKIQLGEFESFSKRNIKIPRMKQIQQVFREIIPVILGILIALIINNWDEDRKIPKQQV